MTATSTKGLINRQEKELVADAGSLPGLGNRIREILAQATAAPFPPSLTDPRILLSDWSHFQGEIDIGKHLAYGPPTFRGVVIRSGQGLAIINPELFVQSGNAPPDFETIPLLMRWQEPTDVNRAL